MGVSRWFGFVSVVYDVYDGGFYDVFWKFVIVLYSKVCAEYKFHQFNIGIFFFPVQPTLTARSFDNFSEEHWASRSFAWCHFCEILVLILVSRGRAPAHASSMASVQSWANRHSGQVAHAPSSAFALEHTCVFSTAMVLSSGAINEEQIPPAMYQMVTSTVMNLRTFFRRNDLP